MRVETIGTATLYLADFREVLPSLEAFDVLLTDPVWPNAPADSVPGCDRPFELFEEMWASLPSMPRRAVVVLRSDSDPRFLRAVPPAMPFFVAQLLQYAMPGYIGRKLGGNEIAYGFGEPIPSGQGQHLIPGMSPKAQPKARDRTGHPMSRCLEHMAWLMRWWSMPDELVVDPYMGSGTTGMAAVTQGRRFVGVEIEPRYFDIACMRVADALRQERLFA